MFIKRCSSLILAALFLLLATGCSGGATGPISPPAGPIAAASESNRVLWGMWDISFDPEALTVDVMSVRNAGAHFDVTDMLLPPECDDCIKIYINSFDEVTRILYVRTVLKNPSGITGYDVHGILYTDEAGHELHNADDWTGLWDVPGGEDINPFIAFAKDEWKRAFQGGESFSEYYHVYIPVPPQYSSITFAVDASWPGNCKEPYTIENFTHTELDEATGSVAHVKVDVRDWQFDVDSVMLMAPEITDEDSTPFTHVEGSKWELDLANNTGAGAGQYRAMISATSTGSGAAALYDYVTIAINAEGIPINPVDVTPPWLCFNPVNAFIAGDYAYVAEDFNGLSIYDITNPVEWSWIANVRTPDSIQEVVVDGGYAYAVSNGEGLSVIDVDPPESAYLLTTVATGGNAFDVDVYDGYAYVAAGKNELFVVDVDPPESAHVAGVFETGGYSTNTVDISDGYLYIAESNGGLNIVDISDPESPEIINTISQPGKQYTNLNVKDGYAFVGFYGVNIFDVDPPEEAHYVGVIYGPNDYIYALEGDYIYFTYGNVQIYDITDPEEPYMVNSVDLPDAGSGIAWGGGYVYVFDDWHSQVYVVDVEPVESAHLAGESGTPGRVGGVCAYGPYVYATSSYSNFIVYDVDPLDTASILSAFYTQGDGNPIIEDGYVYLTDIFSGLVIKDLQIPDFPVTCKVIPTPGHGRDVAYQSGYAYVADQEAGLSIVDVSPVSSAHLVNTVAVFQYSWDVAVEGDYAYVGDGDVGLQIIDINPPESAHIVKTVGPMGTVKDVVFDGGYVYVADEDIGLQVVDVSDPETAYIYKTIGMPAAPYAFVIDGGYAYVTSLSKTLYVVDIDPVDSAYVLSSAETIGYIGQISVLGNYAYVAGSIGGLRIFELW